MRVAGDALWDYHCLSLTQFTYSISYPKGNRWIKNKFLFNIDFREKCFKQSIKITFEIIFLFVKIFCQP